MTHHKYLRNSERSTFQACRWQWHWSYEQELHPRREAPYFRFGTLIHRALELYYPPGTVRGPSPSDTFVNLYEAEVERVGERIRNFNDEDGKWDDALELGVYLLDQFVSKYADQDTEYEVIASEKTVQLPLRKLLPLRKSLPPSAPSIVVAKIDGVWRHRSTGRMRFIDYKTTKQIDTHHLALDPQASLYWLIGPLVLKIPHDEFDGILYTFLRKAMPNPDQPVNAEGLLLNKDGTVSKRQMAPILHRELVFRDHHERELEKKRILNTAREIGMVRDNRLAAIKMPGQFKCNFCQFSDACELHESGSDWQEYLRQTTEHWNPYSDHDPDPHDHE